MRECRIQRIGPSVAALTRRCISQKLSAKFPRLAVRLIPAQLERIIKTKGEVHEGWAGTHIVFRDRKGGGGDRDLFLWQGGELRPLPTPPVPWPYEHAFVPDGSRLFVGVRGGVVEVEPRAGRSNLFVEMDGKERSPRLALGGGLLGVGGMADIRFIRLADGVAVHREACRQTMCVAALREGHLFVVGALDGTRFYSVDAAQVRCACVMPEVLDQAWEEDGKLLATRVLNVEAEPSNHPEDDYETVEILGLAEPSPSSGRS